MTVMVSDSSKRFHGAGSTGPFTWGTWRFLGNADLRVYLIPEPNEEDASQEVMVLLTEGADYTVTGAGSYQGGSITLATALAVGTDLLIERITEPLQKVSIRNQGNNFRPEVHEDVFDRLTMMIQDRDRVVNQSGEDISGLKPRMASVEARATSLEGRATAVEGRATSLETRALRVPAGQSADAMDATEYTNRSGKVLGWNSLGRLAFMAMNFVTSSGLLANPWADVRGYASLADAVASLGGLSIDLVIPNVQAVPANVTVPANIRLVFKMGGMLNIDAGKTVTINGPLDAGQFKIFDGAGLVVFGKWATRAVIPQWWGARGDGTITNEEVYFNAAFVCARTSGMSVEIPPGNYYTSGTITTYVPFYGVAGSGATQIRAKGAFPGFDVQQCHRGSIHGVTVTYFYIVGGAASVNGSCIGFRLMDGATAADQQIDYTGFRDIIVRYGWDGIRYDANGAPSKGQLYEVSFEQIHVEFCQGTGVYLYTTPGTLAVSLKHVSVDAPRNSDGFYNGDSATAKGYYFFNIANLTLHQCLASRIQANASAKVAYFGSCHGIDIVSFQHEMTVITNGGQFQAPIVFAACEDVQLDVRTQNTTINVGAGMIAPIVYFDAQAKNVVIKSMAEQVITVTSGTKKHFTINSAAAGAVNVSVLDGTVLRSNCDIAANEQAAVRFTNELNTYAGTNPVYHWNTGVDYTAFTNNENIIWCDQGTAQTLTIPPAANCKGKVLRVHNLAAGVVTISFGGETYFAASGSPFTIVTSTVDIPLAYGKAREFYSDGTQWIEKGVNGFQFTPPVFTGDGGKLGQWSVDANYVYVCIAANTWKRAALSSW